MRALEAEMMDVLWETIEALLPVRVETHPLGCHRQRVPDRLCFRGDHDSVGYRCIVGEHRSNPGP